MRLVDDARERALLGLELAQAQANLYRWGDAVDVCEQTLQELGDRDDGLAARLEAQLVICGLRDIHKTARARQVLERLGARRLEGATADTYAIAQGIAALFGGHSADEVASLIEPVFTGSTLPSGNWDITLPGLIILTFAEAFAFIQSALDRLVPLAQRSGSARGLHLTHAVLGLLKLRLGMLPEADAAARVALRITESGDLGQGLPLVATTLADTAIVARFDNGMHHSRSGVALALLRLGDRAGARAAAAAELRDARAFGGLRALGIALRVAGLAEGDQAGMPLLEESVAVLRRSPALLQRAHSLTELGAALRRTGQRAAAREPLGEALELAARCGARPLAARAREELLATGARPRREWRSGVDALTPSEMRVARLAAEGRSNREIAQTLYVTLKTVEGHLARAYDKLDVAGRAELSQGLEGEKTRVGTR
jgi:DNA-binding CsgD family transcriptional regulator